MIPATRSVGHAPVKPVSATKPGAMTLAVMPRGASSRASAKVNPAGLGRRMRHRKASREVAGEPRIPVRVRFFIA